VFALSKALVYDHSPAAIVGSNPTGGMFLCCVCCVLSGRGLCDELITHPEDPTDYGASLCMITKPRERGGQNPRWAAEPVKIKK
jgi:hypothetical protein